MGGSTNSSESSTPFFKTDPGAFGHGDVSYGPFGRKIYNNEYDKSRELATMLQGMISGKGDNPYSQALSGALLNPSYAPTSASEQSLLNSIMDVTAGRGAVRGLGAPTEGALAQAIAPELLQARQQNIQNLMGAQGMNMQSLLELIGLSMPQTIGGNASTGHSGGWGILSRG